MSVGLGLRFGWAGVSIALAALCGGCIIEEHHHLGGSIGNGPPVSIVPPRPACPDTSATADSATVDTNDTVSIGSDPGVGVGVLVDYDAGGHWHVWSVCDTSVSGEACGFSVTATALDGNPVTDVAGDNLESGESAGVVCGDTAFYVASTDFGIDGMTFVATPGAAVQIKAALDDTLFPDIISFAVNGMAQPSTTNPMVLTPSSP
ncbi:MAG TPA: hypothetical protein VGL13_18020 [Polyangiaceae bacterium]|jgi:hypothetical protein